MKKLILSAMLFIAMYASAQVNSNAIGIRLSAGTEMGGEISYQKGLTDKNRVEFNLGAASNRDYNLFNVSGTYQWVWNINNGLNWYLGPGASFGMYNNSIGILVGGQVGLEYDFKEFDIPFLVSIDSRPMWNFLGNYRGIGFGTALSVRYVW